MPLRRDLYTRAIEIGVRTIRVNMEGGSDESYYSVDLALPGRYTGLSDEQRKIIVKLEDDIEEWAYNAYGFNGAGDGSRYGDTITYNLVDNTVTNLEWAYVYQENDQGTTELAVTEESAKSNPATERLYRMIRGLTGDEE
jgi:hypothetical protein